MVSVKIPSKASTSNEIERYQYAGSDLMVVTLQIAARIYD